MGLFVSTPFPLKCRNKKLLATELISESFVANQSPLLDFLKLNYCFISPGPKARVAVRYQNKGNTGVSEKFFRDQNPSRDWFVYIAPQY